MELSDAAYSRAQPWPKHDRPARWVLEVARQKILELKGHCETRQAMGDSRFAESLELMAFLANLVGIQHIQRFVPLAEPGRESASSSMSQTVEMPQAHKVQAAARARPADDSTREMPRLKAVAPSAAKAPSPPPARAAEPAKAQPRVAAPRATAPVKPVAAIDDRSSDHEYAGEASTADTLVAERLPIPPLRLTGRMTEASAAAAREAHATRATAITRVFSIEGSVYETKYGTFPVRRPPAIRSRRYTTLPHDEDAATRRVLTRSLNDRI